MMRLMYFPANAAWAFVFGSDLKMAKPLQLHSYPMFFDTRRLAVAAARVRGLKVDRRGFVRPINPSNMN